MFTFQDVLERAEICPKDVNIMLHSPRSGGLQEHLPGLVRTRRKAMETYQAYHRANGPAERALSQGRPYVASFVKTGVGSDQGTSAMLFTGLYLNDGGTMRPRGEIETDPEVQWMHQTFGTFDELKVPGWTQWKWFDFQLIDELRSLQGRLVIQVRLTQSYVRLAENLDAPILAIHQESRFDVPPPPWQHMSLNAGLLQALPERWRAALREWRGVYLILDETDGQRYVGSAYGKENLLGRWCQHVASEVGVTAALKLRDPRNFRFSILERVSPDMVVEDVVAIESSWKKRLHTRDFGLNEN